MHFDEFPFGLLGESTHRSPVHAFLLGDPWRADTFSIRIGKWIREWIVIAIAIIEKIAFCFCVSATVVLVLATSIIILPSTRATGPPESVRVGVTFASPISSG